MGFFFCVGNEFISCLIVCVVLCVCNVVSIKCLVFVVVSVRWIVLLLCSFLSKIILGFFCNVVCNFDVNVI